MTNFIRQDSYILADAYLLVKKYPSRFQLAISYYARHMRIRISFDQIYYCIFRYFLMFIVYFTFCLLIYFRINFHKNDGLSTLRLRELNTIVKKTVNRFFSFNRTATVRFRLDIFVFSKLFSTVLKLENRSVKKRLDQP